MSKICHTCLFFLLLYTCLPGIENTKNTYPATSRGRSYYQQMKDYYYRYYKYKAYAKRRKWPKVKGRCAHSSWKIDDINPVIEEAKRGNAVTLLALKPSKSFSKHQLGFLNDLALYYKSIGLKMTFMALTHNSEKLPEFFTRAYPHIKFFQEPRSKSIYKKIYAKYGHVIVYDQCGRQQYSIGPPHSYHRYDFINNAITNTIYHYEMDQFCGKCLPYVEPTGTPSLNSTLLSNSTTMRTLLSTKRRSTTNVPRVDGPYTNLPIRRN